MVVQLAHAMGVQHLVVMVVVEVELAEQEAMLDLEMDKQVMVDLVIQAQSLERLLSTVVVVLEVLKIAQPLHQDMDKQQVVEVMQNLEMEILV